MIRIDGKHSDMKLPIMEQLYLNKRPELIMIYNAPKQGYLYILRLWRSNYKIRKIHDPLWIGNLILAIDLEDINPKTTDRYTEEDNLFKPLLPIAERYRIIDMHIKNRRRSLRKINDPKLLIFEI